MSAKKTDTDQFWRQLFKPLRSTPPMDPQIAAEERSKFLLKGAALRSDKAAIYRISTEKKTREKPGTRWSIQSLPAVKLLVGIALAFIILVGSSATVYASQSSLPGEPLYLIKSWSEDLRLSLANSPQSRLNLTLNYSNRRVNEIASLVAEGVVLSEQESQRYEYELDTALAIAAQMGDEQIRDALKEIKTTAQKQGITMEELVMKLPEQAAPAIEKIKARIEEQLRLSRLGEEDIQAFRNEIRERHRNEQGDRNSNQTDNGLKNSTPAKTQGPNTPGNNPNKGTDFPGNNNPGSNQGKSNPENGKNDPNK